MFFFNLNLFIKDMSVPVRFLHYFEYFNVITLEYYLINSYPWRIKIKLHNYFLIA